MQSILLSVSKGYTWYTTGQIETEKADRLIEKFNEKFGVLKSKLSLSRQATRASRKAAQEEKTHARHSATLVIHPTLGGVHMNWVLLATGPLYQEQMLNALNTNKRLGWNEKYQLVQIPKKITGQTWTWKLTRKAANDAESMLIRLARSDRKDEFLNSIEIIRNYPMFSGIRTQLTHALDRGLKIWNRQHPHDQIEGIRPLPIMTRQTGYANPPMTLGAFQEGHKEAVLRGFLSLTGQAQDISA